MTHQIDTLNQQISELTQQRNNLLKEFRQECKHLKLFELDAGPPRRICVDCGAEEEGWYCGYQVLTMDGDFSNLHTRERVLVGRSTDLKKFHSYRKEGPLYFVGQSHLNFSLKGSKTYQRLTEV